MGYQHQIGPRIRTSRLTQWRWRRCVALCLVAAARITSAQVPARDSTANPFADAIRRFVEEGAARSSRGGGEAERTLLRQLYGPTGEQPLWSVAGNPTHQALKVIDVLGNAERHGLRPTDYDVDAVRGHAAALAGRATPQADVARFDVSVSRSLMRLLAHLRSGRVDPQALGFDLPNADEALDLSAVALGVSHASDVPEAVSAVAPPYAGYAALTRALVRYRVLAADTTLRPPATRSGPLRPATATPTPRPYAACSSRSAISPPGRLARPIPPGPSSPASRWSKRLKRSSAAMASNPTASSARPPW